MAARSSVSRALVFILGLAGMVAGVIFLLGIRHFKSRFSEIALGIGGISGGLAMMKVAMTHEGPPPVYR